MASPGRRNSLYARAAAALCALVLLIFDGLFLYPISPFLALGGIVASVVVTSIVEKQLLKHLNKTKP